MAALGKLGRLAMGGGAAALGLRPEESEAAFGGILARGADTMMMDIAQKMKNAGIPREEIWQKTGWFQGVDDKWRFEIPDQLSSLDEDVMIDPNTYRLRESVNAGDLWNDFDITTDKVSQAPIFQHYPDMAEMPVWMPQKTEGVEGYYQPMTQTKKEHIALLQKNPVLAENYSGSERVMAHELQHGIQEREGFEPGANLRDPFYWENAGEVEARNVERRLRWSNDMRRAIPPWESAARDIPENQQHVTTKRRFGPPKGQGGYASPLGLGALSGITGGALMAPRHPRVAKAADALRGLSRRLEGSPMGLFAPDATAEWLGKLAYGQRPTWSDRIGVLFDWM